MRRQDIHSGDLLAWSFHRNGKSEPGVALGPIPMVSNYQGKFSPAKRGGAQYLLLIPTRRSDGDHADTLNDAVDHGRDADFWGFPEVADFVARAAQQLTDQKYVDSVDIPAGWRWSLVAASLIRGQYPPLRAADVARNRQAVEAEAVAVEARARNVDRLDAVKRRLAARGLDAEQVGFVQSFGAPKRPDPELIVPIPLLEMLLDSLDK